MRKLGLSLLAAFVFVVLSHWRIIFKESHWYIIVLPLFIIDSVLIYFFKQRLRFYILSTLVSLFFVLSILTPSIGGEFIASSNKLFFGDEWIYSSELFLNGKYLPTIPFILGVPLLFFFSSWVSDLVLSRWLILKTQPNST